MTYERFQYLIEQLHAFKYVDVKVMDFFLSLIEEICSNGIIKDKLKMYIYDSNFGENPKIVWVNNGRDQLKLDSIQNLWIFIKQPL